MWKGAGQVVPWWWRAMCAWRRAPPCRVHTLSVPVVSELAEMYKSADHTGMCCLLAKLAVEKTLHSKLEDTRTFVHAKVRMRWAGGWAWPGNTTHPRTGLHFPLRSWPRC